LRKTYIEQLQKCRDGIKGRVEKGELPIEHVIHCDNELLLAEMKAVKSLSAAKAIAGKFAQSAKAYPELLAQRPATAKTSEGETLLAKAQSMNARLTELVGPGQRPSPDSIKQLQAHVDEYIGQLESLGRYEIALVKTDPDAPRRAANALQAKQRAVMQRLQFEYLGAGPPSKDKLAELAQKKDEARRSCVSQWKGLESRLTEQAGGKLPESSANYLAAFRLTAEKDVANSKSAELSFTDAQQKEVDELKDRAAQATRAWQLALLARYEAQECSLDDLLLGFAEFVTDMELGALDPEGIEAHCKERVKQAEKLVASVKQRREQGAASEADELRAKTHLTRHQMELAEVEELNSRFKNLGK
jgi:hypothetical protein